MGCSGPGRGFGIRSSNSARVNSSPSSPLLPNRISQSFSCSSEYRAQETQDYNIFDSFD